MKVVMELDFKSVKLPNGKLEYFDNPKVDPANMVKQSVAKFINDMVKGEKELFKKQKINAEISWKFQK